MIALSTRASKPLMASRIHAGEAELIRAGHHQAEMDRCLQLLSSIDQGWS